MKIIKNAIAHITMFVVVFSVLHIINKILLNIVNIPITDISAIDVSIMVSVIVLAFNEK